MYNFIRKSGTLNFLFHNTVESEWIQHFPYVWLYKMMMRKRAKRWILNPPVLTLLVTDMCNARCTMCLPELHRGKKILRKDLFEKAIREAGDIGIKKIFLSGGEPLLDEDIFDKIVFAKTNGIEYIQMFTNGQLLNEERAKKLIAAGLDDLTISFDSVIKKEYEKIRIGLNFATVFEHIRNFQTWRKEMNSHTPLFRVNRLNMTLNVNSAKNYIKALNPFADIVELMDTHNWATKKDGLFTEGRRYTQKTRYPCNLLFQQVLLSPQGDFKKCCIDYSSTLANYDTTSLREIIHSHYKEIKKKMLNYDFSIDGCQNCTCKQNWWTDWDLQ